MRIPKCSSASYRGDSQRGESAQRAPLRDGIGQGFCRGLEVTVEFDEEQYAGSSVFLFSAVLERFLALYTTLNSATRLLVKSKQSGGYLKRWPFRSGERAVVRQGVESPRLPTVG